MSSYGVLSDLESEPTCLLPGNGLITGRLLDVAREPSVGPTAISTSGGTATT